MLTRLFAIALAMACTTAAQAGTLDKVKSSGSFTIGYRQDAQPFAYKTDLGEAAGYSVELCRAVASAVKQALNLKELKIDYVPVTAENRFDELTSGKIDILCGATTQTLSRREKMDFSITTFIDGASVLFHKDGPQSFQQLAGKKVGVRGGTTTETSLAQALKAAKIDAQIVKLDSHQGGLDALTARQIDAYFADRAILTFLLIQHGTGGDLMLSQRYFTYEPYALALQHGDWDFRLLVDRTLSDIYRSGAISRLFAASFGEKAEPSEILKAMYLISTLPE